MVQCLVAKLCPSAKHVFITANNCLVPELDVEVLVLAVGEPDAVLAILLLGDVGAPRDYIDLLIDLILLLKDELFGLVESRLQRLQNLDHEGGVLSVGPLVEGGPPI